jgi:hypothetical protein
MSLAPRLQPGDARRPPAMGNRFNGFQQRPPFGLFPAPYEISNLKFAIVRLPSAAANAPREHTQPQGPGGASDNSPGQTIPLCGRSAVLGSRSLKYLSLPAIPNGGEVARPAVTRPQPPPAVPSRILALGICLPCRFRFPAFRFSAIFPLLSPSPRPHLYPMNTGSTISTAGRRASRPNQPFPPGSDFDRFNQTSVSGRRLHLPPCRPLRKAVDEIRLGGTDTSIHSPPKRLRNNGSGDAACPEKPPVVIK